MSDFGPVGGAVASVAGAAPAVVEMQADHNLADGDRVRIGTASSGAALLYFAKCTGYPANTFGVYSDVGLKAAASLDGVQAGMGVVKLAFEDYAIVAGINTYPSYSSLKGPVADARRFVKWLKESAFVPDDQVRPVVSPASPPARLEDAQPKLDEISGEFVRLARLAYKKDLYRVGRRLYVFLSGHGILPTRTGAPDFNESALLMANTDQASLGYHLGGNAYAEWFRTAGVFDEVVLFMDCCRDWKDNVALTPPAMPPIKPQRDAARRFYAAATQLDSKSWERPFGTPPEICGVFSHVLMEALESQLCDANGLLTGQVLAGQLYKEVPALQNNQLPDISYKPEFDIVFARRTPPAVLQARVTFGPALQGQQIELLGGSKYPNPDETHLASAVPWIVKPLKKGLYQLRAPNTGAIKYVSVDGKQEVLDVDFS